MSMIHAVEIADGKTRLSSFDVNNKTIKFHFSHLVMTNVETSACIIALGQLLPLKLNDSSVYCKIFQQPH